MKYDNIFHISTYICRYETTSLTLQNQRKSVYNKAVFLKMLRAWLRFSESFYRHTPPVHQKIAAKFYVLKEN